MQIWFLNLHHIVLVIMHTHIPILTLVALNIGSMGTNIIMDNPPNLGNKDGEGKTIHIIHTIPIFYLCSYTLLHMHLTQCLNHQYINWVNLCHHYRYLHHFDLLSCLLNLYPTPIIKRYKWSILWPRFLHPDFRLCRLESMISNWDQGR